MLCAPPPNKKPIQELCPVFNSWHVYSCSQVWNIGVSDRVPSLGTEVENHQRCIHCKQPSCWKVCWCQLSEKLWVLSTNIRCANSTREHSLNPRRQQDQALELMLHTYLTDSHWRAAANDSKDPDLGNWGIFQFEKQTNKKLGYTLS